VVQEEACFVLRGIGSFQARSLLRTWAYRILLNIAKTRGTRDARIVPTGSLTSVEDDHAPTVEAARFRGPDDQWPGGWRSFPPHWPSPEQAVVAAEMRRQLAAALAALLARQRGGFAAGCARVQQRGGVRHAGDQPATCGSSCTGPACAAPWRTG
jgi:RNA polymerase sigma-70 factor (ECF subfamily)